MASNKKYWKSVEELNENSSIVAKLEEKEFVTDIATDEFLGDKETLEDSSTSRRDFLKYVGFSTAAVSLAACEGPVVKSIPYVVQPDEIIPGIANYYASTIADGFDFANVLVKTREGRPILIKPKSPSQHRRARSVPSFPPAPVKVQTSLIDLDARSRGSAINSYLNKLNGVCFY